MTREDTTPRGEPDRWTGLLSDYLDGELPPEDRLGVEAHLPHCLRCSATLEELRAVVHQAPTLRQDEEPQDDLWPAIHERLQPRSSRQPWLATGQTRHGRPTPRHKWLSGLVSGAWPGSTAWLRPAIAAAVLVLAVAAGLIVLLPRGGPSPAPAEQASSGGAPAPGGQASSESTPAPGEQASSESVVPAPTEAALAQREGSPAPAASPTVQPLEPSREYYDTLAQLRRAAHARLAHDPQVVEVLEQNLEVLDVAIAQYADALAAQPGDARLASRLESARQRKLDVLRQAVDLAAEAEN